MTSDPLAVIPSDHISRAAEIMRDTSVGCVPIVTSANSHVLLGVITDRDIAVRCVAEGHEPTCDVRSHMTGAPLQTVGPDADISEVIEKMEAGQVRRIPVVGDRGILIGIVAQADLAMKLGPKEPLTVEEVLERISAPACPVDDSDTSATAAS
jgi:CBS domain-containing protein